MIDSVREFIIWEGNGDLLDFGCGDGQCGKLAESVGARVVYADIYKHQNLKNKKLPFKNESFDIVVSEDCIEHFGNHELFYEELKRITRRGGKIILATSNIHNWYSRLLFLLTGKIIWFNDSLQHVESHIRPLILEIAETELQSVFGKNNVKFIYEDSTIPLIHWKLPLNKHTGREMVILLNR